MNMFLGWRCFRQLVAVVLIAVGVAVGAPGTAAAKREIEFPGGGGSLREPVTVTINGVPLLLDEGEAGPFIDEGNRVLVPVRALSEALGANVYWNGTTRTVFIARDTHGLRFNLDGNDAEVDGRRVWLDVPPRVIAGRSFLPLRFTVEALGEQVAWDQATGTAHVVMALRQCDASAFFKPTGNSEWMEIPLLTYGCMTTYVTEEWETTWKEQCSWTGCFKVPVLTKSKKEKPVKVVSKVRANTFFKRIADDLPRDVIKQIEHLVEQYLKGNPSPGGGTRSVGSGTNIFYLRHDNGGRVFMRWQGDTLEILAFANKTGRGNSVEEAVIDRLIALYGG